MMEQNPFFPPLGNSKANFTTHIEQLALLISEGLTVPATIPEEEIEHAKSHLIRIGIAIPVGKGWTWAADHDLLEPVTFPVMRTLGTSQTPDEAGTGINAPVPASNDLAKITRPIQAVLGGIVTRPTKRTAKHPLVPVPAVSKAAKAVRAVASAELGKAIRAARTTAGLSQIELAALLKTTEADVVGLEEGGSLPSTSTLQRIAEATGHKLGITFTRDA